MTIGRTLRQRGINPPPVTNSVAPSSPHRFWRLAFDATKRGNCGCATLELRTVRNGPSVAVNGTPMSDADPFAGYESYKAFDNNVDTCWASEVGSHWIGYDLVSSPASIVELGFIGREDGSGYYFSDVDSPQTGGVEYSDDGLTWVRLFSIVPPTTYVNKQFYNFTMPGAY